MKFYSEVLDEIFDSEKECLEAELDRKRKQKEAEEKRNKEAEEKRRFEAEKAFAKANLEKKIQALNKEVIEYVKTYENENPFLVSLVEALLEPPSQKEKRPTATPITSNEFERILKDFLN